MSWSEKALSYVHKISCSVNKQLYLPFLVEGKQCGIILRENVGPFQQNPDLFSVSESKIELVDSLITRQQRSSAINKFFATLRDDGIFSCTLKGT